jgi:hypothetical protein
MDNVANSRRRPGDSIRHLTVVRDDHQPNLQPRRPDQSRPDQSHHQQTHHQQELWDSQEPDRIARLRELAVTTGAPADTIQLIDNAATAGDALELLTSAGLLPDDETAMTGMLSWFSPLLEAGCDQVEAEVCGAEFIGEIRRAAPADTDVTELLTDIAGQLGAYPIPESLAMARVLAVLGPPSVREAAAHAASRLAAAGLTDPPWAVGLGAPKPGPFFGYGDIYGEQRSVVLAFRYGRKQHALIVLIDYVLGGGVKDCSVVDYTDGLRRNCHALGSEPDVRFSDLGGAQAREILDAALAAPPCPLHPDQAEDVENYLDLLAARVALLPGGWSATTRKATGQHGSAGGGAATIATASGAGNGRISRGRQADAHIGAVWQAPRNVHRLKVTLRGVKPPIWRRLEVPSDISLSRLNTVIQQSFGWQNSHPHLFETPVGRYGSYEPDLDIRSGASKKLSAVADWPGDKILYVYDFGDYWEHDVLVEAVQPAQPGVAYPQCTSGRRACPPEDSGGPWGYGEMLKTLASPRHENHAEMLQWLGISAPGEFDPEQFDVAAVRRLLARKAAILIRS